MDAARFSCKSVVYSFYDCCYGNSSCNKWFRSTYIWMPWEMWRIPTIFAPLLETAEPTRTILYSSGVKIPDVVAFPTCNNNKRKLQSNVVVKNPSVTHHRTSFKQVQGEQKILVAKPNGAKQKTDRLKYWKKKLFCWLWSPTWCDAGFCFLALFSPLSVIFNDSSTFFVLRRDSRLRMSLVWIIFL